MNIINDNTYNLHNSLLDYNNKVTLKSQLIGVTRVANFDRLSRILNLHIAYNTLGEFLKIFFVIKVCLICSQIR